MDQQKNMKTGAIQKRTVPDILSEVMKAINRDESNQAQKDKKIGLKILSDLNA